jgi:phosphoribosylformylglycinamidine synthase
MKAGKAASAFAAGFGGMAEAVSKMAFGNKLGVFLTMSLRKMNYSFRVMVPSLRR